jgi:transcriptional regulator with GAF, ATPase, and Fis domain
MPPWTHAAAKRPEALLTVPLRTHQGEVVGAFQALNQRDGAFSAEDEEILKTLAVQVAITIENVKLLAQLQQRKDELEEENTHLRHEVEGLFSTRNIIGTSHQIQSVICLTEQISDSSVNVLITGESGTGKELVARAIHYNSLRSRKPFIALNCAALPDDLVESELFGIEKGVATGVDKRIGRFEAATAGTLFLDEIGDLSLKAQAKILRALQENVVERVGSTKPIPVHVRILAATNKNPESEVEKKLFREDLYYRLNVLRVRLPALREITRDIPLLAEHFLAKICADSERTPPVLQPDAIACLENYDWPGNIRQLENEMRRLIAMVRHKRIFAESLADELKGRGQECDAKAAGGIGSP